MTLSNLEYCTVVSFSSMKSLTLFPGGIDKCVIRCQPDVFLGTNPMGEHLKFEIGRNLKGPAILPRAI